MSLETGNNSPQTKYRFYETIVIPNAFDLVMDLQLCTQHVVKIIYTG